MELPPKVEHQTPNYPPQASSSIPPLEYTLEKILEEFGDLPSIQFNPFVLERGQNAFATLPPNFPTNATPFDYFSLFFTYDILQTIAKHTNEYAASRIIYEGRKWTAICPIELYIFIGAIVYMGIHVEPQVTQYWNTDNTKGPIHLIPRHLSLVRFAQIKRYLHISSISSDVSKNFHLPSNKIWWYKLEPLASHLQAAFRRYYSPSSEVSINKLMVRCFGRSQDTYKMPNKPIKQGYKIYGIADHGYLYAWIWSSKEKGLQELLLHPTLTNTGCLVCTLACTLPRRFLTIYMDNYFTSVPLFEELRRLNIRAVGTTRAHAEFPKALSSLRTNKLGSKLEWNTLLARVVQNTLCLAWQDNNIVLALSNVHTVHTANDFQSKVRKRPAKSSTNGRIVRKVFGDEPTKVLDIPCIIVDYNNNMGGVDIANQIRESYEVHQATLRNWWPLLYWFIDVPVINAYRLYIVNTAIATASGTTQFKPLSHLRFRTELYQKLFGFSLQLKLQQLRQELGGRRVFGGYGHKWVARPTTSCVWCLYCIRYKKTMGVISKGKTGRERAPRLSGGCKFCEVNLCRDTGCWEQFHEVT